MTSIWSDGTPGPLAYCIGEGRMSQEDMIRFNNQHIGESSSCKLWLCNALHHSRCGSLHLRTALLSGPGQTEGKASLLGHVSYCCYS